MNDGEPDDTQAKTTNGSAGQSEQEAMVVLTTDVATGNDTVCTGGCDIEVRGGGRWSCLRWEVPCR